MHLIIQIPCFNEENTLPLVVRDLPKKINGISKIEYLIIDDGSRDHTVAVAKKLGIRHIVSLPYNQGLANAFRGGLEACLELGADIVVNTDGDNQYNGGNIPDLVKPILDGKAGMVIGERPIMNIEHFSFLKKILQKFGSYVVRKISNTSVIDAPSGFRAFSRDAIMQLNLVNDYTYTLESIIQAGHKRIPVANVPITTNGKTRESRLMKSIPSYIKNSLIAIIRTWISYASFRIFLKLSLFFITGASFLGIRYLYFMYFDLNPAGHVQSLILMTVLFFIGFQMIVLGLIGDMISSNRKRVELMTYELRKMKYSQNKSFKKKS